MVSYTPLVAFLLLFIAVGIGFLFVHLVAGKLLRPNKPDAEKKTIYECGEPTIGSAWIQFDLRFYVVALLFVIFDVEVAFFFPWAEVFGSANAVAAAERPTSDASAREYGQQVEKLLPATAEYADTRARLNDVEAMKNLTPEEFEATRAIARNFAWFALLEILAFFGVLLIGFAYLWKRGDLAWVRSTLGADTTLPIPQLEKRTELPQLVGSGTTTH